MGRGGQLDQVDAETAAHHHAGDHAAQLKESVAGLETALEGACEGEEYTKCLHVLFEAQVERTPDLLALVDGDKMYTYQELNEASDMLAAYLRTQGVRTETVVGIFMERSAEYVVAYLAALKAGAAYCPIELAYPKPLVKDVCENVRALVILTKSEHVSILPEGEITYCMDSGWLQQLQAARPADSFWKNEEEPTLDSMCYLVYSSGTTGKPKGITADHRSPVYSYVWRYVISDYRPGDRVACNVFFVWEVLRPLFRGATSYVIPDNVVYDTPRLVEYLEGNKITEVLMTPSLLESVLNSLNLSERRALKTRLNNLKVLWMNGEVVTVALRQRFLDNFPESTRLLNTYSISETGEVCCSDLREDFRPELTPKFCSVGKPAPFCQLFIVHFGTLDPVEPGEVGELYLGGKGVARGYLGMPELTAQRFIRHPVSGERMYKTGDQARILPDGSLEVLGRCDSMVKIRGYSVVLSAVEAAVTKALGVKSCAVVTQGEEGSQHKRLVAYLVKEQSEEDVRGRVSGWVLDPVTGRCLALTKVLAHILPHYAVPSVFVELDRLPLLPPPMSKVDKKQLPPPPPVAHAEYIPADLRLSVRAPLAERIRVVCAAMEEALGLEPDVLDEDSDFFAWGGHSLSAAALSAALRRVFSAEVSIPAILAGRTPGMIARALAPAEEGGDAPHPTINPNLAETMMYEAELGPELEAALARADYKGPPPPTLADAELALLTGCTGFFGAFLLAQVARQFPKLKVWCLARSADPRGALKSALARFDLLQEGEGASPVAEAIAAGRVVAVRGDLSQPRFGLPHDAWDQMVGEVDVVVHCAAYVNLVLPYSELRASNVEGTRAVLQLVAEAGAALHYVSTNAVFPWRDPAGGGGWSESTSLGQLDLGQLTSGYAQTKWVAEHLVWNAVGCGLSAAVYRPGNLGGDTATGAYNPSDANTLLLAACARLGLAPSVPGWRFESTPVDFAARAVVGLAATGASYGQAFHLTDGSPVEAEEVLALLGAAGRPVTRCPKEEWLAALRARAGELGDLAVAAQALAGDAEVWSPVQFDSAGFDAATKLLGLERPPLDAALVGRYLVRMQATGLL